MTKLCENVPGEVAGVVPVLVPRREVMAGWKIRLAVIRRPDGRAELTARTHLPRTAPRETDGATFTEESIVLGPEGSGATPEAAFAWACERLRTALGDGT